MQKKKYIRPAKTTVMLNSVMQTGSVDVGFHQPDGSDDTVVGAKETNGFFEDDAESESNGAACSPGLSWIILIMAFIITSCSSSSDDPTPPAPPVPPTPPVEDYLTLESFSLGDVNTRAAFNAAKKFVFEEGDSMLVFSDQNKEGDKGVWYYLSENNGENGARFKYDPEKSGEPAKGNNFTFVYNMGNMDNVKYKTVGSVTNIRIPQNQKPADGTFDRNALPFIGKADAVENQTTKEKKLSKVEMYALGAYIKVNLTQKRNTVTLGNISDIAFAADAIDLSIDANGKIAFTAKDKVSCSVTMSDANVVKDEEPYLVVLPAKVSALNKLYFNSVDADNFVYFKKPAGTTAYEIKNNYFCNGFNFDINTAAVFKEILLDEMGIYVTDRYVGAADATSYGTEYLSTDVDNVLKCNYPGYRLMTQDEVTRFIYNYSQLYTTRDSKPRIDFSILQREDLLMPYGGDVSNQGRQWYRKSDGKSFGVMINDYQSIQFLDPQGTPKYALRLVNMNRKAPQK